MCSHNSFKVSNLHKARHYLTQLHTHFTHRELLVLLCKISSLAEVIVLISTALRRDHCTTEHCISSHAICLAPLLQRCCQVVLITSGNCAKADFFFFKWSEIRFALATQFSCDGLNRSSTTS